MRHVAGTLVGVAVAVVVLVLLALGFPDFVRGVVKLQPDTAGTLLIALAAAVVGAVLTPPRVTPAVPLAAGVVLTVIGAIGVTPATWPALFSKINPGLDLLTVMGYGMPLLLGVPLLVAGLLRVAAAPPAAAPAAGYPAAQQAQPVAGDEPEQSREDADSPDEPAREQADAADGAAVASGTTDVAERDGTSENSAGADLEDNLEDDPATKF